MLGIDRRTLETAWTLFLFALLLIVIYETGRTLVIFALALIFAHLLAPVVGFMERRLPRSVPRVATLGMVYVVLLGALVAVMIPLGSRISEEASSLAGRLPQFLTRDPLANLPIPKAFEPLRPQLTSLLRARAGDFGQQAVPLLTQATGHILSGVGAIVTVILIPILAFFFLKDGAQMRDAIVDSFEPRRRELVAHIFADLHLLLGQYIRALVLLSLATFLFYSIALAIMGAPYPLLLSGLAAALEFIPVVGPLIAAASILIVAAFAGFPHMLALVLFLIVYRLFQDYVLSPYLMSSGVEIHPMLVLFGVLAGEQLFGIPGMFFSVPVMAALRLIVIRTRKHRRSTTAESSTSNG
jgi:predicted PurR-regulated permease PerM